MVQNARGIPIPLPGIYLPDLPLWALILQYFEELKKLREHDGAIRQKLDCDFIAGGMGDSPL